MFKHFAVSNLEKTINRIIHLDNSLTDKLIPLQEKVIAWHITDLELLLFCTATDNQLHLQTQCLKAPDLTITGTLSTFVQMARQPKQLPKAMKVAGDAQLAQQFQMFINSLDLDWETKLASIVGNVPAYYIGKTLKKTREYARYLFKETELNTKEFLQEETLLLPTRSEIDTFCHQTDELRHRVARLEARYKQLASMK